MNIWRALALVVVTLLVSLATERILPAEAGAIRFRRDAAFNRVYCSPTLIFHSAPDTVTSWTDSIDSGNGHADLSFTEVYSGGLLTRVSAHGSAFSSDTT